MVERDNGKGLIFDIKKFSTDDGPGIRTTIFFKGCPLHCLWCHSPESIKKEKELLLFKNKCIRCMCCVEVCPNGAQIVTPKERIIDREKCNNCGRCVEVCPVRALKMAGKEYSVSELLNIIKEDKHFYKNSKSGGVTFSGGEAFLQYNFLYKLMKKCKEIGLHTVVDTTGYTSWDRLKKIADLTDIFLYDLKHMDSKRHKEYTGVSNEIILTNLKNLSDNGSRIWIRVPMIPGYNTTRKNFEEMAVFLVNMNIEKIVLLNYNTSTGSKYSWLNQNYVLEGLEDISQEKKLQLMKILYNAGLTVEI